MWTLVTTLLLSSLCCGSAQILFKNIKSATVTDCEKDVVIPCHATNMEPESLDELYLKWYFGKTPIFIFDGTKNTYSKIPAFQSGQISTSAFLKGDASLTLDKNEAIAGNYTCEVTELSREGKQTVELKYNCSSAQILFKNIKSATVTDCEKDVVIPCHATNVEPESLDELYLIWSFGTTHIFLFDGSKNTYSKIPAFQSGRISTSAFLKGDASLTLDKNEAIAGNYTCEVTELSREGKQTVELKYNCSKTQILFENITSVTVTNCIKDVIIPCNVSNINAKDIKELSLKWIFGKTLILTFEGHSNTYSILSTFKSAQISTSAFLKGDASLTLDRNEAKAGNYTCEVKELSREGRHTVELKYHCVKLLFKNIKSLMIRDCEKVVIIPCYISNIKAEDIKELSLKWNFEKTRILTFGGHSNTYTKIRTFKSARISIPALLKGNASLMLDKNEAKVGSYTCEVKQLNREGRHTVKLKQHRGNSWFPFREYILIIIFPFLTSILFWAQFAILMQKYESNISKRKTIVLSTSGLLFTMVVIFGASHFIPGDFSEKKSNGLIFLVIPSVIPVFLQYHKFMPAIGRTLGVMITLTVIQTLGSALAVVGLYFSVNECAPKYGSLVVSGLFIVTLVELLGLIYMKWLDPHIGLNET